MTSCRLCYTRWDQLSPRHNLQLTAFNAASAYCFRLDQLFDFSYPNQTAAGWRMCVTCHLLYRQGAGKPVHLMPLPFISHNALYQWRSSQSTKLVRRLTPKNFLVSMRDHNSSVLNGLKPINTASLISLIIAAAALCPQS